MKNRGERTMPGGEWSVNRVLLGFGETWCVPTQPDKLRPKRRGRHVERQSDRQKRLFAERHLLR